MAPQFLPNELLELIVSNIDPTSRAGRSVLRACSRANQALGFISQKRLFEDVTLSYKLTRGDFGVILFDDEKTTGHKFLSLLNASPHISSYTKKLTIEELPLEAARSSETFWSPSDAESFSLYAITARCQGLKNFVSRCYINWTLLGEIEERTEAFFFNLVQRVQELDYRTFHSFPLSAFFRCHNVQRLHISSLSYDIGSTSVSQSDASQVQLLSLDLSGNSFLIKEKEVTSWFDSPESPLNITLLQSLTILVTRDQVPAMEQILILCSDTLENIELRADLYLNTILTSNMKPLNLGTLLNVRNLEIRIIIAHYMYRQPAALNRDSTYLNDFSYAASILQTLPLKPCPYPTLQLNLNLHVSDFRTFEKQTANIPWLDLVRILDEDEMPLRIARVNLLIKPFEDGGPLGISLPTLTSVLDRIDGLRELKEKGFLFYGSH